MTSRRALGGVTSRQGRGRCDGGESRVEREHDGEHQHQQRNHRTRRQLQNTRDIISTSPNASFHVRWVLHVDLPKMHEAVRDAKNSKTSQFSFCWCCCTLV